jgi:hypothetical protein
MQPHPQSQWRGTWRCAGHGASYVEGFREPVGGVAPSAEMILARVLVPITTVSGSPYSSAAGWRNWFRGSALPFCVVRLVGRERHK